LLAEVQQSGEDVGFLVHLEAQSYTEADFARRMFFYFARLYQKYRQRVYPIVVFSFDEPYRAEANCHIVEFQNRKVLEFSFEAIQLNRLDWRDFLSQRNPVAAALMAKMQIMPEDRPKVKAECLRILATLRLDAARTRLISGFVDTYLRLNSTEETLFQAEVAKIELSDRREIMQIVTSWMQQGIEQGIEQGERSLIFRLLGHQVGTVPDELVEQLNRLSREQLESLGEALLDFGGLADLEHWLVENV
jgi:hypothetical protein